jgi:ribosomal protein L14E/L6E/L27E
MKVGRVAIITRGRKSIPMHHFRIELSNLSTGHAGKKVPLFSTALNPTESHKQPGRPDPTARLGRQSPPLPPRHRRRVTCSPHLCWKCADWDRINRYPEKITKRMGAKRVHRRSRVKPFIKVINYNHLMPTRYTLELDGLKGVVAQDTFKEPEARKDAKKTVKKVFEERFQAGKNRWFFQPLRF